MICENCRLKQPTHFAPASCVPQRDRKNTLTHTCTYIRLRSIYAHSWGALSYLFIKFTFFAYEASILILGVLSHIYSSYSLLNRPAGCARRSSSTAALPCSPLSGASCRCSLALMVQTYLLTGTKVQILTPAKPEDHAGRVQVPRR